MLRKNGEDLLLLDKQRKVIKIGDKEYLLHITDSYINLVVRSPLAAKKFSYLKQFHRILVNEHPGNFQDLVNMRREINTILDNRTELCICSNQKKQ